MLKQVKNVFVQVCVPDELDMAEHYQTPAEKTADLIVHVVGLTLAAVGGIVLAVLAAIYSGIGAVVATSAYALCLIAMLTAVISDGGNAVSRLTFRPNRVWAALASTPTAPMATPAACRK